MNGTCIFTRYDGSSIELRSSYIYILNLTYSRWISSLPYCLWSLRIFPSLPGSRLTISYRDASSALLQLFNQWLNFTYSRSHAFRYERKRTNPTYGKNRTHDFCTTSRCAGYLLDHSGDNCTVKYIYPFNVSACRRLKGVAQTPPFVSRIIKVHPTYLPGCFACKVTRSIRTVRCILTHSNNVDFRALSKHVGDNATVARPCGFVMQ